VKSTEQFAWPARNVAKFMPSRPGNKDGRGLWRVRRRHWSRWGGGDTIHSCVAHIVMGQS